MLFYFLQTAMRTTPSRCKTVPDTPVDPAVPILLPLNAFIRFSIAVTIRATGIESGCAYSTVDDASGSNTILTGLNYEGEIVG